MTVYEKARELGEMILETKEGKRLYDAKFIYGGDDDAKKVLTEYMMYRNILRSKAGDGSISEEELKSEIQKLNVLGEKAKENAVVKELMDAEDKFNTLVRFEHSQRNRFKRRRGERRMYGKLFLMRGLSLRRVENG